MATAPLWNQDSDSNFLVRVKQTLISLNLVSK